MRNSSVLRFVVRPQVWCGCFFKPIFVERKRELLLFFSFEWKSVTEFVQVVKKFTRVGMKIYRVVKVEENRPFLES